MLVFLIRYTDVFSCIMVWAGHRGYFNLAQCSAELHDSLKTIKITLQVAWCSVGYQATQLVVTTRQIKKRYTQLMGRQLIVQYYTLCALSREQVLALFGVRRPRQHDEYRLVKEDSFHLVYSWYYDQGSVVSSERKAGTERTRGNLLVWFDNIRPHIYYRGLLKTTLMRVVSAEAQKDKVAGKDKSGVMILFTYLQQPYSIFLVTSCSTDEALAKLFSQERIVATWIGRDNKFSATV